MTRKNRVRKSKMADIISSKQTKIRSTKLARRLGRSHSFSMRFFFLAREKMKLAYESDLKVNQVFLRKLFGKRSQKNGGHFNVVLNASLEAQTGSVRPCSLKTTFKPTPLPFSGPFYGAVSQGILS